MIKKALCTFLIIAIIVLPICSANSTIYEPYYVIGDTYKIDYKTLLCPGVHCVRNLKTGEYYYSYTENRGFDSSDRLDDLEWKRWEMPDDYYEDLKHQKLNIGDKEYDIIITNEKREAYYNGKKDDEVSGIIEQAWQTIKEASNDIYAFKIKLTSAKSERIGIVLDAYCLDFTSDCLHWQRWYPDDPIFWCGGDDSIIDKSIIEYNLGNLNFDDTVNMLDVVTLQRYVAKYYERINIITADANLDGLIDMIDVVLTQRIIAKL